MGEQTTYEQLINHNPLLADVVDEDSFEYLKGTGVKTIDKLQPLWEKNADENFRLVKFPDGLLSANCAGFGTNKATVMIGAGPSLRHNWEYLKKVNQWNWSFPFEAQPFIFIASNHQFRKCLKDGIVPHFVLLADGSRSESIARQMCKHSKIAKRITLIASPYINPKITKYWVDNKRVVQFYTPDGEFSKGIFEKYVGDLPEGKIIQGGNVMNLAWAISMQVFQSRIFICVGNDLSYDLCDTVEQRREGYYHDGDYSSNLASKRDEAGNVKKWVGFQMYRSPFMEEAVVKFVPKGTTGTLYTYKQWLETYMGIQDVVDQTFHYYNCSEEGILGVIPKSRYKLDMDDVNNWRLLDEVLPRRYHTRLFEDTVTEFLTARELCRTRMATEADAEPLIVTA